MFSVAMQCFTQRGQSQLIVDTTLMNRSITLIGGVSFPAGSFATSTRENSDVASIGITFGAQFSAEIFPCWEIVVTTEFYYHPYDGSAQRDAMLDSLPKYTVHAGDYIFAELLIGIRYDLPINADLTLFCQGQAGAFIGQHPEMREDNITPSGSGRRTTGSALACSPAFDAGCGVVLNSQWSLGVAYTFSYPPYTLTIHEAHGTTPTAYYSKSISQSVSTLRFIVGYIIAI
jgi:hypothetical protein